LLAATVAGSASSRRAGSDPGTATEGTIMRSQYSAPTVTTVASVADLTRGNESPVTSLDADYPAQTRFEDLGWSS
jgi:hypothetical protein